jgi:hypothetical protein
MQGLEALIAFNHRRADEERARAELAGNARDRALHLEMASIFERRADVRKRLIL